MLHPMAVGVQTPAKMPAGRHYPVRRRRQSPFIFIGARADALKKCVDQNWKRKENSHFKGH